MGGSAQTAVVPVKMVNVQTDTAGDDQFSPGVGWHVPLDQQNCDMTYWERLELLGMVVTVLRTVGVAHPMTLIFVTPEILKQGGNGLTLRRLRVIGSPIVCMRTGNKCILRMLLDWSLLRSRSLWEGALLARSCFLPRSCWTCMVRLD